MKNEYIAILCILCLVVGFFAGRKTITTETEIRYVKGNVIRDTIRVPVPVHEVVSDTIVLIERDTIQTLIDWNMERIYFERLYDNNNGIFDLSARIQYNKVQEFSYELVPVYKEITKYNEPAWKPFVSASYSTFDIAGIGGGVQYKKIGFEYQYQRRFNNGESGHLIGINYIF